MDIFDELGFDMETSNTRLNKLIKLYILGYVFFSGFVYFEPSFTEFLFIIFTPLALLWGLSIERRALFLLSLAIIANFLSLIWGLYYFRIINLRYNIIDIYLCINLVLLFSSLCRISSRESGILQRIMNLWILTGLINISACFAAYFLGRDSMFGAQILFTGIRFQGFFKDPNVLGPFLIPPAVYMLEKILCSRKVLLRNILCLLIFSVGILFSFSRAAWLNYALSILVLFITCFRLNSHIKARIIKLILLAAILLIMLFNLNFNFGGYTFPEFLKNRIGLQEYDAERFKSQGEVVLMVTMSPLFGIGPGNYMEVSPRGAHSLYIRALGEKGIIGFLLLILLIAALIFNKKAYSQNKFVISSFYGVLINSFFIDTLHWRHAWILAALLLYIIKAQNSKRSTYPEADGGSEK